VLEKDEKDRVRNVKKCYIKPRGKKYPITIKRGKANWIDHILRRNCLLTPAIEDRRDGNMRK
jgi:hypothetical protein